MILFSIIIPHYTTEGTDFLKKAVQSIPERNDIEVLIVDNSPVSINVDLFQGRLNTNIYYSDNNLGAGGARNVGLEHACGKWLLFLDADDFFTDDAFHYFDQYKGSDFDIIFFKPTSLYPETGEIADRHIRDCKYVDEFLNTGNEYPLRISHCCPICKMIRKSFVNSNNIKFEEISAGNDVMFALNLGLKANKITAENAVTYVITVSNGSITNTLSLKNINARFGVTVRKNAILKEYGYKGNTSVMIHIYNASRFGFCPCVKLIWKALITGNLFNGWRNWLGTLKGIDKTSNI